MSHVFLLASSHDDISGVLLGQGTSFGKGSRPGLCAKLERAVIQHELLIHAPIDKHGVVVLDG